MLNPGKHLVLGNIAAAEGALRAGCRLFAGYPITPANEITEYMSAELPKVGGFFLQMEDEIASIAAVIGASWAGAKAMTATSGPGFSLMQENLSYAHMTETPLVVVDVQRSGPSTGQSTDASQQDFYQARYGAHGDYEIIALSPWSAQEMFDLAVRAFNLAEQYRTPIYFLPDGMIGHIREELVIPEKVQIMNRKAPSGPNVTPFGTDDLSLVPDMPKFGQGYRLQVTGSSHRPNGVRDYSPKVHAEKVRRIMKKIAQAEPVLRDVAKVDLDDAKVAVVSFGASARPSYGAVKKLREEGIKAGLLRLKTLWPLPEEEFADLAGKVDAILVVEMNAGKLVREVQRVACGNTKIASLTRLGGVTPTQGDIAQELRRLAQ
jgi:2-oxoglutarate/2-oxoacid ferredoxin oxidoreductase subunit alpha